MDISLTHSVAISCLADRVEREARLGRRIKDVLHLHWKGDHHSMGCIHVGPGVNLFIAGRRYGKTAFLADLMRYSTPFGFCNSREVAAELTLRQILALESLQAARAKGRDVPYLHVWEITS